MRSAARALAGGAAGRPRLPDTILPAAEPPPADPFDWPVEGDGA